MGSEVHKVGDGSMTTVEFCVGILGGQLRDLFDHDSVPTAFTFPSDVPGSSRVVAVRECNRYLEMPLEEIPLFLIGEVSRFDRRGLWWMTHGAILLKRLEMGI